MTDAEILFDYYSHAAEAQHFAESVEPVPVEPAPDLPPPTSSSPGMKPVLRVTADLTQFNEYLSTLEP